MLPPSDAGTGARAASAREELVLIKLGDPFAMDMSDPLFVSPPMLSIEEREFDLRLLAGMLGMPSAIAAIGIRKIIKSTTSAN